MSGFAKLIPAFTAHVIIDAPSIVGPVSSGNALMHVKIRENEGYMRSEPDYPIKLDAVFLHGSDYIRQDPDKKHVRLQVDSVLQNGGPSGGILKFSYTGTVDITGPAGKVLSGAADAKTSPFGEAFTHVSFETGSTELKEMEHKVYVASGRFILEDGKSPVVEYKISEVTA